MVTSGGGPEEPVAKYLERALLVTGIMPVGSVFATMGTARGVFSEEVRAAALRLGRNLVKAWKEKKAFPRAEQEMAAFRERMRWLVGSRKNEWGYEYDYWRKHLGLAS